MSRVPDPVTAQFLRAAIAEGAHRIPPRRGQIDLWIRRRNILGSYYCGDATLQEVADVYANGKRQSVHASIVKELLRIYENASPRLRALFPLDDLRVRKITVRHRAPARKGFRRHPVVGEIQLAAASGDDAALSEVFDRVPTSVYKRYSSGEDPLLTPLYAVGAGVQYGARDTKEVVRILRDNRVPVGCIEHLPTTRKHGRAYGHYYFVLAAHLGRVRHILQNDPRLARFRRQRVKQVAGPPTIVPRTVREQESYPSVWTVLRPLGLHPGSEGDRRFLHSTLPRSPVPVFADPRRGELHFRRGDADVLARFVEAERARAQAAPSGRSV